MPNKTLLNTEVNKNQFVYTGVVAYSWIMCCTQAALAGGAQTTQLNLEKYRQKLLAET
jgi:hypothetical protein